MERSDVRTCTCKRGIMLTSGYMYVRVRILLSIILKRFLRDALARYYYYLYRRCYLLLLLSDKKPPLYASRESLS